MIPPLAPPHPAWEPVPLTPPSQRSCGTEKFGRRDGAHLAGMAMPGDDAVPIARCPAVSCDAFALELRPADLFVFLARRFTAQIRVYCDSRAVSGKSIPDLSMLPA
jgi:hypothetical protein